MAALSAVILRPARADEGAQLADLRVRAMRESLQAVGRFDPARARARFLDSFEPADTQVVECAGQDVGLLVLRRQGPEWLLDHLYIDPEHQGRGLGTQVLQNVLALADQHQRPLRVGALKGSRSNAFYQSHGFSLVETSDWDLLYLRQPGPANTPLPTPS